MQLAIRDSGALQIGNIAFERYRLRVDGELGRDQMVSALEFLTFIQDCSLFWWADICNVISNQIGEDAAKAAAQNAHNSDRITEMAHILRNLSGPRFELSADHYREAFAECCGIENDINEALRQASENRWDVVTMRWWIRQQRKTVNAPAKPSNHFKSCYSELHKLQSRIQSMLDDRPIADWSIEEVNSFNADLDCLLDVAEPIRKRFDEINPELALK